MVNVLVPSFLLMLISAESLYQVNRNLERQLRTLQTEIAKLKKKISVFEVFILIVFLCACAYRRACLLRNYLVCASKHNYIVNK